MRIVKHNRRTSPSSGPYGLLTVCLLAALLLGGCGQKGPLVLSDTASADIKFTEKSAENQGS